MGIYRGSGAGERVGIDRRSGVAGGESGNRQAWGGRGREWGAGRGREWGLSGRVGLEGERVGIDRRKSVWERERVGIGVGEEGESGGPEEEWGENGDRKEGWGGSGRVGIARSGVGGGEIGDRQEEEWLGEGESGNWSGVEGGEWG